MSQPMPHLLTLIALAAALAAVGCTFPGGASRGHSPAGNASTRPPAAELLTDASQAAALRRARQLTKNGEHAAALSALLPLPRAVQQQSDRELLALAGGLLLRLENAPRAEEVLEMAVADLEPRPPEPAWKAPALANLAKARLATDRLAPAAKAYRRAAAAFSRRRMHQAAAECMRMGQDIERILGTP